MRTILLPALLLATWQTPSDRPLEVRLPITPAGFRAAVGMIFTMHRLIGGAEFDLGPGPVRVDALPSDRVLSLTRLSPQAALTALTNHYPGYDWEVTDGTIAIRPAASRRRPSFLDTRVARFEINDVTAREALVAVHRLFDATYPAPLSRPAPGGNQPSPARFGMDKTISVHLTQVTVGTVLTAIAKAHGAIWWSVTYRGPVHYESASITLTSFDKWSVAMEARPIELRSR